MYSDKKTNNKNLRQASKLQRRLQTKHIGKTVMWFKKLSSTQEFARRFISNNGISFANGYVIISNSQQNGLGRFRNKWISPRGGIWLSIILRSSLHPSRIMLFSYCASVAVSKAIERCTGLQPKLKWPNDILMRGRKVSGILVDASVESESIENLVIGIGINANVKAAHIEGKLEGTNNPYPITSLQEQLGRPCNKLDLIRCILQIFDKLYSEIEADNTYPILDEWKKRAEPIISKSVQISCEKEQYSAKVVNLEEDGSLVVLRQGNRLERIVSSDYHVHVTG
jgi:BirA family transcriptional regulator, biotin operon repressor / biotin---[acetyl-CoA-carboxylase] ligase